MKKDWDKRFSGVLGEEYNLFKLSVPHHDEFQDKITELLEAYASSKKDLNVLEAGTGTGLTTFRILNVSDDIKITTVDNEEKTLDQARETFKEEAGRITFVSDDILSFLKDSPGCRFDAFVSAYVIHNLEPGYRKDLFEEIGRALKKGGVFINADKYAYDNEEEQSKALQDQIKAFDIYDSIGRQDLKVEWTKHYYEDEEVKITEREQKEILQHVGFENIEVAYRKGMEAVIVGYKLL